jgi:predicted DNA-binding transcriptional regulator AlpA
MEEAQQPLDLVNAEEASEILGGKWSRQKVYIYLKRGTFPQPYATVGHTRLWRREQIEQYKSLKGENKHMKNELSDNQIERVLIGINKGLIRTDVLTYVFVDIKGNYFTQNATNEEDARKFAEYNGKFPTKLIRTEVQTIQGYTIPEILAEAEARGIEVNGESV